MSMVVDATYENGVLKPDRPLPLAEHEKVQVTVHTVSNVAHRIMTLEAVARFGWPTGSIA